MRPKLSAIAFAILIFAGIAPPSTLSQTPGLTIDKQPETFTNRSFDPAKPPADMPPLSPGEDAECDSNFLSDASVGGQAKQTDATHATVTITQIKVTLQI